MIFVVAGVIAGLWFKLVPLIFTPAELERNERGEFLVSVDNYDDWGTYAAVFSRVQGNVAYGVIDGDFVLRVVPRVVDKAPSRIENPGNYLGKFYSLNPSSHSFVLIYESDNPAMMDYHQELVSSVKRHNDELVKAGFDADPKWAEPEWPIEPIESWFNSDSSSLWMEKCKGKGCKVNIKVEYASSIFEGPNVTFVGSSLVLSRKQ